MALTYADLMKNRTSQVQERIFKNEDALIESISDKLRKKDELKNILGSDNAYWNPRDNFSYVGMLKNGIPSFKHKIQNIKLRADLIKKNKDDDNAKANAFVDSLLPEFQGKAQEYLSIIEKADKDQTSLNEAFKSFTISAGTMDLNDFAGLRNIDVLGELVINDQLSYSLQLAGTQYRYNKLFFRIPKATGFDIAQDLDEFEKVEAMKMSFSTDVFRIYKDAGALMWSDEFLMEDYDQQILPRSIQTMLSAFERARSTKGAVQLLLAGNTVNSTYQLQEVETTSDHSKTNIAVLFKDVVTYIESEGGQFTGLAMNGNTHAIGRTNSSVRGLITPSTLDKMRSGIVNGIWGFDGVTGFIDRNISNGIAIGYDQSALYNIQGLIMTNTDRTESIQHNAMYVRNYNGMFLVEPKKAVKITNLIPA